MLAYPVEMHRRGGPQALHSLFGQDGVYHPAIHGGRFPAHEARLAHAFEQAGKASGAVHDGVSELAHLHASFGSLRQAQQDIVLRERDARLRLHLSLEHLHEPVVGEHEVCPGLQPPVFLSGRKVSISSPGFVAGTHREAIETSHPYFESGWMANHHQRDRGVPMPLAAYEAQSTPAGAFFLGSPQEVIDKILAQYELFQHDRMTIQMGFGNVPQKEMLTSIELLGTEVAPVVRKEITSRQEAAEGQQ